jgi:hypothetical protein
MYRSTVLFFAVAFSPVVLTAPVNAQTCDFKRETAKVISHQENDAIKRADNALKALLKDVPNYKVGGPFFPEGGDTLKTIIVQQFVTADKQFDALVRRIVVARVPLCELCDLQVDYERAAKVKFPRVDQKQLVRFRKSFQDLVEHHDTLADLERLRKKKQEAGHDTYDLEQVIQTYRDLITNLERPIKAVYDENSHEAVEFEKKMKALKCV